MQTVWMGLGLSPLADPTAVLEGLTSQSLVVVLDDTPGVVQRTTLPAGTKQVWLWTATERVWYALDETPGPIPAALQGNVLDDSDFVAGAVLLPSQWQALGMDSTVAHDLYLVSAATSPVVYLTVWVEAM